MISTRNIQPSFKTSKGSSYGISYVNTLLQTQKDRAEGLFNHWKKLDDQPRNRSRLQNHFQDRQIDREHELFKDSILERARKSKGAKLIHQERMRDSSSSSMIKIFLGYRTNGNRFYCIFSNVGQTGRQTLSFQPREHSSETNYAPKRIWIWFYTIGHVLPGIDSTYLWWHRVLHRHCGTITKLLNPLNGPRFDTLTPQASCAAIDSSGWTSMLFLSTRARFENYGMVCATSRSW